MKTSKKSKILLIFPVLFLCVCFVVLLRLGIWQQKRMVEKQNHAAEVTTLRAQPPVDVTALYTQEAIQRRVRLTGVFDHSREVLLENQRYGRDAGYRVVTPFVIDGTTDEVLIDRGWTSRNLMVDNFLAPFKTQGQQTVEGVVLPYKEFKNFWGGATEGVGPTGTTVLLKFDPAFVPMREHMKRLPVYVQATTPTVGGLKAFAELPETAERHREYMYTWFTLAFFVAVMGMGWVRYQWRKLSVPS